MKNLIVQAQRLGDLVMTYPLFIWLKKQDDKEIFVLAEEKFYKELLHISPLVTYIPTDKMAYLKNFSYDTVINLSHREDTAKLVSTLDKNNFYGLEIENGCKKISGKWQLYRTSLTHNNHYNRLHWADLNALDCIDPAIMHSTKWKIPQGRQNGKIGLFVGASEKTKRPSVDFWAELAFQLCKKGYDPVFISGPGNEEKSIAYAAAKKANIPHGVIAGSLSIFELIHFLETLQLFICPDTGPMHIASFANVPTLNLSIGPVNPWETAPYPPYHYVLRSGISCSGCWQCTKEEQFCRRAFVPHRIANLVHSLLLQKPLPNIPSITLYKTGRNTLGLYELEPIFGEKHYHSLQADFWRSFFLYVLSEKSSRYLPAYEKSKADLFSALPKLKPVMQKGHINLIKTLVKTEKTNSILEPEAWKQYPPLLRPLTSYVQLLLENGNYSKEIRLTAMKLSEEFRNALQ